MSNKANKGSFRIISGKYKGRKFEFLPSKDLRPTPDRLRETLFNWLGQVIDRKTCLDLFSGTGSLGLESLSRGAQEVTFVEKNFKHFDKIKSYIKELDAVEDISIINRDVLAWLDDANNDFDLIFVDPPFYEQLAEKVLLKIKAKSLLAKSGNIYLEVEKDLDLSFLEKNWEVNKETNSGKKRYLLLKEK
jgi:16S rRNA (guanine966-N2)-methyltransferase